MKRLYFLLPSILTLLFTVSSCKQVDPNQQYYDALQGRWEFIRKSSSNVYRIDIVTFNENKATMATTEYDFNFGHTYEFKDPVIISGESHAFTVDADNIYFDGEAEPYKVDGNRLCFSSSSYECYRIADAPDFTGTWTWNGNLETTWTFNSISSNSFVVNPLYGEDTIYGSYSYDSASCKLTISAETYGVTQTDEFFISYHNTRQLFLAHKNSSGYYYRILTLQ